MPNSRQSAAKEVLNLYDQIGKEEAIPASVSPDAKKLAVPFAIFRKAVGALDDEGTTECAQTLVASLART
jgi:hypothetical protein